MKLFLTGLIWIALSSWLLAQENITPGTGAGNSNSNHKNDHPSTEQHSYLATFRPDYKLIAELGYGTGGDENINGFLKAEVINGVQFSPQFYLGIGTGIRDIMYVQSFWDSSLGTPVVPIYLDVRMFFSTANVTPYISLDMGYSFDVDFGITGLGMLLNPMFGVSIGMRRKHPVHVAIGYNAQWETDRPDSGPMDAFALSAGITF